MIPQGVTLSPSCVHAVLVSVWAPSSGVKSVMQPAILQKKEIVMSLDKVLSKVFFHVNITESLFTYM